MLDIPLSLPCDDLNRKEILRRPVEGRWMTDASLRCESRLGSRRSREHGAYSFGDFQKDLKLLGIADCDTDGVNGGYALLSHGVQVRKSFSRALREILESHALQEVEYPSIASPNLLERLNGKSELKPDVLEVIRNGDRRAGFLIPSGEFVIYPHLAERIGSASDLPVRIFRKAAYYRPRSKGAQGCSLVKSSESRDIFEFYTVHADRTGFDELFLSLLEMQSAAADAFGVRVIFSVRPPWTNNTAISHLTVGGDILTPAGDCLQCTCLYDQGHILSEIFNITYRSDRGRRHTEHIVGAITRRMMWTHYMICLYTESHPMIHPEMRAYDVVIRCHEDDLALAGKMKVEISREFSRVAVILSKNNKEMIRMGASDAALCSVSFRIFQRRGNPAVVMYRFDSCERIDCGFSELGFRIGQIPDIVFNIMKNSVDHQADWHTKSIRRSSCLEELGSIVGGGRVALVPVSPEEEPVRLVESSTAGEVLGFVRGETANPCVASGRPTEVLAYVARRI